MTLVEFNLRAIDQTEEIEIDDWEQLTETEREDWLSDWANNYIDIWFAEVS